MKYLCMIYFDEQRLETMPAEESAACIRDSKANNEALRKSGHLIAAHALESVSMATTVRHHEGRVSATDGPFAETKEQLGGFVLIEARDLDEAIGIASNHPAGRLGCVEVRPIATLE
jgi:hypothetical protein